MTIMQLDDFAKLYESTLTGEQWANALRRRRIRMLTSPKSPIPLAPGCRVFLHIVPIGMRTPISFRDDHVLDTLRQHGRWSDTANRGFNADGWFASAQGANSSVTAYQIYTQMGWVEQCVVYTRSPQAEPPGQSIPGESLHAYLVSK